MANRKTSRELRRQLIASRLASKLNATPTAGRNGNGVVREGPRRKVDFAAVVTATVVGVALFKATERGDTTQEDSAGARLHAKVTE
jgi:hypothetical protein